MKKSLFIIMLSSSFLYPPAFGETGNGFLDVMDFGAAGDGTGIDTKAIQKAVDSCSINGGAVLLPPGKYLTGTIYLKDNVTVEIMKGAIILGSTNLADYPKNDPDFEFHGSEWKHFSLFYAEKRKNITFRGEGAIDGQGWAFPVPNEKKPMRYQNRPYVFWFILCENIRVEGIHMTNSVMWMQHYLACDGVYIRGISVYNHINRNNDMIDIDGCRNVIISDCRGDTDDDALTFKSTSDRVTENVTVTNCILSSHCNAIKFGTESNGGFRNVTITDCVIKPSSSPTKIYGQFGGDGGLALEIVDGGIMDGIVISNIRIDGPLVPIFIRLGDRGRHYRTDTSDIPPGILRNVMISNIVANAGGNEGCSITGIPGSPVENIHLNHISIRFPGGETRGRPAEEVPELASEYPEGIMFGILPAYGIYIRHARNISLSGIFLDFEKPDNRPAILADDVRILNLEGLNARSSQGSDCCLELINSSRVKISNSSVSGQIPVFAKISGARSESIELPSASGLNAERAFDLSEGVGENAIIQDLRP